MVVLFIVGWFSDRVGVFVCSRYISEVDYVFIILF